MPTRYRKAPASPPSVVLLDAVDGEDNFGDYHIEPLRVRTERLNWSIPAHVHHGLHQIFAIEHGRMDAVIDGENLVVEAPALLLAPSAAPHAFRYVKGSSGQVLTVRPMRSFLDPPERAARLESTLFSQAASVSFTNAAPQWSDLMRLFAVLESEAARRPSALAETATFVLAAALSLMARRVTDIHKEKHATGAPHTRLFAEFERLVDTSFGRHRNIAEYAAQLHVSVSTLDRLCRDHAGVSAARYVRSRVYVEARRRLAYSDAPIQHIAEDLGFADAAYFSRFITRHAGLSPSALRRQLRAARANESGE